MKNLKLNTLASDNLSKVEMNQVVGGNTCTCGCQGPSSTIDNGRANMDAGKHSTQATFSTFIDGGTI